MRGSAVRHNGLVERAQKHGQQHAGKGEHLLAVGEGVEQGWKELGGAMIKIRTVMLS